MRLIRLLVAVACLAIGIAIGALNTQRVQIDLGFAFIPTSLGIAVLAALLLGVLVGGLVLAASVVMPLRQRLRQTQARNGPGT